MKQFGIYLVDKCLIDPGYYRSYMTDDRRKHLEKLKTVSNASSIRPTG